MLLQIIDIANSSDTGLSVEVKLNIDGDTKSYQTTTHLSRSSGSLVRDLAWYFQSSMTQVPPATLDKNVIGRLLKFGKELGDELIGEDFELMAYREFIEDKGYSELEVRIESSREEFFVIPWESLILPDANYVLASVAKGFHRCVVNTDINNGNEIEYALTKENPLRITHFASRLKSCAEKGCSSTATANVFEALLTYDGAINYRINTQLALDTSTLDGDAIHIWHYDGPVSYQDGEYFLVGCDGQYQNLQGVAEGLAKRKCSLICFSACLWENTIDQSTTDQNIVGKSISEHLGKIANICMVAGVPNMLGFNQVTDPWSVARTLLPVYQNLARGLSLSQSVVEARKHLQSDTQCQYLTLTAVDFQTWPLLEYYQSKPIIYFAEEQAPNDVMQTAIYSQARQNLHGFLSECLYPHASLSVDSKLVPCISMCLETVPKPIALIADGGLGKTQLVHGLGFYLVQHGVSGAFYFDYQEHAYTVDDIKSMIKPIVEQQKEAKNLFIFDNFAADESNNNNGSLVEFVASLSEQGHPVVFTSEQEACFPNCRKVYLSYQSTLEQKAFSARAFATNAVEVKEAYQEASQLIEHCHGSPFLISGIAKLASKGSFQELDQALTTHIPFEKIKQTVSEFYQWQWQQLTPAWQRWLLLLNDLPGVVVEMLGVVTDANEPPASVHEFNQLISNEDGNKLLSGVAEMERAGFLVTFPYGRVINSKCSSFIREQLSADTLFETQSNKITQLLNQIICQALVSLIPKVLQQSHQPLIHNLLVNRKQWAMEMEKLWDEQQYELFLQTLAAVSKLMQQAQLSEELAQWGLDALARFSKNVEWSSEQVSAEYQRAWIKVAGLALNAHEDAFGESAIKAGVNYFDVWLKELDLTSDMSEHASLFTGVVQFLQSYYQRAQQWQNLSNIADIGARVYRSNQIWPLYVPALNLKLECAIVAEKLDDAASIEHQLMHDVPYEKLPQGFHFQVLTQVITTWMKHKHFDLAQRLLDSIKGQKTATYEVQLLSVMQADIYFQTAQYPQAKAIYAELVENGLDQTTKEGVQKRLDELELLMVTKH